MIITKTGKRQPLPKLFAYHGGVYCFEFYGDETYIDPVDSSVWHWVGYDNTLTEILSILESGQNLIPVISETDCLALPGSFFWNDTLGILFVHWFSSKGDWAVSRQLSNMTTVIAGYASSYDPASKNVFDGVFYTPIITAITGLSKNVDPLKFGLIQFKESSITLTDPQGVYDRQSGVDTVGIPIKIYNLAPGDLTLSDDKMVFYGFLSGYQHNRDSITYPIIENRLFENKPVCPTTVTQNDFPDSGENDGTFLPQAWGVIRRGIMTLINIDALDSEYSGTAIFRVSDATYGPVRAITNVFDKEDIPRTITYTDLILGEVRVTKPAGVPVSELKEWSWKGEGYDIPGIFSNGLDIIKSAFKKLATIPYLPSTFDTTQWAIGTIQNTAICGLSVKSDKGFIESVLEPITVSLQGVVDIRGDGRISFFSRNPESNIKATIEKWQQEKIPTFDFSTKEMVSDFLIEYAPNFVTEKALQTVFDKYRNDVIINFGVNRREPLSPIKTILVNETDVLDIGEKIMATSRAPIRNLTVALTGTEILGFFDVIKIDSGYFNTPEYQLTELLGVSPDFINGIQKIAIREIGEYTPPVEKPGEYYSLNKYYSLDRYYEVTNYDDE